MTTAARPTFDPARGKGEKDLSALTKQYSSRDLPGQTKLKYREPGQGTSEEIRSRDLRKELEEREKESSSKSSNKLAPAAPAVPAIVRRAIEQNNKRQKLDGAANLDADDPADSESSDDDSDDDTAALLAELSKIKRERAQEQARADVERKQEEEKIRMENILSGNPLINYQSAAPKGDNLKVKRRWDDDVVFKNCARTEVDKKHQTFINDSLRSDFHKKFMEKYIK